MNLLKQDGRGENGRHGLPLKGVFTEEIGEQLKSELLECYEIR